MTRKVRILRKAVSFRSALWRFNNLLMALLDVFYLKPRQAAERMRLDDLRAQKIAADIKTAELRQAKLSNDLVLQDQKIEENNRKAGRPPEGGDFNW